MNRRSALRAGVCGVAIASAAAPVRSQTGLHPVLRFGTTPVFLDDQVGFLARWGAYLSAAIGTPVDFVSRRTYRDIVDLLRGKELDAAWICGFPFVTSRSVLHGLSIPLYHGEPLYQSYLIVRADDDRTASIADLHGKVFAYSDPDSNSGWLVPRTTLIRLGRDPDRHFGRTFFTWGHRNVVSAVAAGLAHGGAVDGYVWDTLQRVAPAVVGKTRVAWRSAPYGFPPLVSRAGLDSELALRLKDALVRMRADQAGRLLLDELNLDGFTEFEARRYDGVAELASISGARP